MHTFGHDRRGSVLSSPYRFPQRRTVRLGGAYTDLDSGVDRWPVVARSNELRQLTAALLARRGAVISGAAGVGKTTLAVTGMELAERRGMSMARATATRASRSLPFGALAWMLPPDPDEQPNRRPRVGRTGVAKRKLDQGSVWSTTTCGRMSAARS